MKGRIHHNSQNYQISSLLPSMASAYVALSFLFFAMCIYKPASAEQNHSNLIHLGSTLSPQTQATSWHSPSGRFAFGFHPQGSGFIVGIWLVGKPDIITWTAFRDDPPVSSNAALELTNNGELLLRSSGNEKRLANLDEPASYAQMLDSGNFVLCKKDSSLVWESFSFPTNTILAGQSLYHGSELYSSISEAKFSTGKFRLKMQEDGNLVLYPVNTLDSSENAYWSSDTFGNNQIHLYLNYTGQLLLLNRTSYRIWSDPNFPSMTDYNTSIVYRATLEYNGFLKLYSHNFYRNNGFSTSSVWSKPETEQCTVKGICGFNSYCTMIDDQYDCRCLPGNDFLDINQRSLGCERNYAEAPCKGAKNMSSFYEMVDMVAMEWDDWSYSTDSMTEEDCRKSCLEDCYCFAALFKSGNCRKQKLPLKYGRRGQAADSSKAFVKRGLKGIKSSNVSNTIIIQPPVIRKTSSKAVFLIVIVCVTFVTLLIIGVAISSVFIFKSIVVKSRTLFGLTQEITLRAFSYEELRKATSGFKEELGKGSFGSVYKGSLHRGKKIIAVKRLEKVVDEGEKEFLTEMRAIGKTHHKNLVRLLGYCIQDSKRLLVYEYMSNGSLADLLFRSEKHPDWNERMKIALDVAKGILYLHDECEAPIIHCDIKPQNILMDKFWNAKISDFGLAKLLVPDQTRTFTMVRGTRGYLAPEWHKNTPISVKADVYSYGVVLLEIVCCRRNLELNASKPEEVVLCNWVYERLIARELDMLVVGQEVDKQNLEKMVMVGLWCIQDEPALRPSMKSVVMMLDGISDVSVPPCPTSNSA